MARTERAIRKRLKEVRSGLHDPQVTPKAKVELEDELSKLHKELDAVMKDEVEA